MVLVNRFFALLVLGLLVASCSRVQFAYNQADWLMMRRINSLLELEGSRRLELRQWIDGFVKLHRQQKLPKLVQFLQLSAEIIEKNPPTRLEVDRMISDLEIILEGSLVLAVPGMVQVLLSLKPKELLQLQIKLKKENEKQKKEILDLEEAEWRKERRERLAGVIEFFIEELAPPQEALLDSWVAGFDYSGRSLWVEFRESQQAKLFELLSPSKDKKTHRDQSQIEAFLTDWAVHPEKQRSLDYQNQMQRARERLRQFVFEWALSLTPEQKNRLVLRLRELSHDFSELSRQD